jgi:hypothetical protein
MIKPDKKISPFVIAFLFTTILTLLVFVLFIQLGGLDYLSGLQKKNNLAQVEPTSPYRLVTINWSALTWTALYTIPSPTLPATSTPTSLPATPNPALMLEGPNLCDEACDTTDWIWKELPGIGLILNLPGSWNIDAYPNKTSCGQYGGLLASYTLTNQLGDYLEIDVACPPWLPPLVSLCYNPVVIDKSRQIFREDTMDSPPTNYSRLGQINGQQQCPLLGWPVNGKWISASYYNRKNFRPDFPTVDRIMLSIRKK